MTVLEYVEEYGVQSGLGAALVDRESDRTYQSTKPRRKSMEKNAELGMDFVETLLMRIFRLPQ